MASLPATATVASTSRPLPPTLEPDWAGLHCDVLALILKRMKLIEDYVVFGSVCKSWRIVARDNKRYLAPQIPWLILQENPKNEYHRQIYSLSKEDILTKNLYMPELHDKRCIGLNYGWVLTVTRLGGEMKLVHPISRSQIELPPYTSIEDYKDKETWPSYTLFSRVALRGNPSETPYFMVMAATGDYVYYWRPGGRYWILVMGLTSIQTLTCYWDQFYAVSGNGRIFALKNDDEGSIVPHLIGKINSEALTYWTDTPYIVGSTRGLLVVVRERYYEEDGGEGFRGVAPRTSQSQEVDVQEEEDNQEGDDVPKDLPEDRPEEEMEWEGWRYGVAKFHVFEFDLIKGGYKQIKDLGDRAIFVGHSSSMCFDRASKMSGIKSNHIYFTDDNDVGYVGFYRGGGRDMGVYGLEDGRITQFKIDESSHRSRICPPFWFIPSL